MNSLDLEAPPPACRVVVAMSGGVDSSVTAALLREQGYDVVGITLQLYDHGQARGRKGACCAGQDIHDARRVADALDMPHYVLNYERRFRESVIDDFADSYLAGETPIPCVRCNQTVKFRDLLDVARDLGAQALATGHYARRTVGPDGPELHRAADLERDQSYFLFATTRAQLQYLRFPLGDMAKAEVRAHAARFSLLVADKADSQDICFVPRGSYAETIARLRPDATRPGDIVDLDGRVLGRHQGVIHYTVGQRRGLGLGGGAALYVARIEPESGRVVVGPREALLTTRVPIRDLNWLGPGAVPADGLAARVKLRSTQAPLPARVFASADGGGAEVVLEEAEAGVAPGQACVIYDGERLLGGGWITRADAALAAA